MREQTSQVELLAALLDGRLDDCRRGDVVARLAIADEEFKVFAGAVGVVLDPEAVDRKAQPRLAAAPQVHPPWRSRPRSGPHDAGRRNPPQC